MRSCKWNPRVCVVDELAHSNAPGSARQKRWQDVQVLLQAGIDVLTTMNVQDLASLSDQIWQLTGLRVRETVPDWLFQQADEVVIVDVTPRALLHRLERGVIYPTDRAKSESERFFQEPILVALRELAIRQTAQALEARQTGKTKPRGIASGKNPGQRHSRPVNRHAVAPCPTRGRPPAGSLHCRVRPFQGGIVRRACRRPPDRRSPPPLRRESAHCHRGHSRQEPCANPG